MSDRIPRELRAALQGFVNVDACTVTTYGALCGAGHVMDDDSGATIGSRTLAQHKKIIAMRRAGETIQDTANWVGCSIAQVNKVWKEYRRKQKDNRHKN